MTWTREQHVDHLLRRPWTIVREVTPEGDLLLRVLEIPSAVGTGASPESATRDLWDSLRESIRAYLHFGDEVPLPKDARRSPGVLLQPPAPYILHVPESTPTAAAGGWQSAT